MANDAGREAKNVAGALTSMSIDEMISGLAIGIAEGQMKLDEACMKIARFMGDAEIDFGKKPGSNLSDQISLMELGFTPNFYQFVDTILEVKVAISSQFEETREFDKSVSDIQSSEYDSQQEYESSRNNNNYGGGSSSSRRGGVSWRWGGVSWGHSSSNNYYGYSSSSAAKSKSSTSNKRKTLSASTVDAKYASTYNYSVEACSSIKTKIVPVPPPDVFEEIIRGKIQERREWEDLMNHQYEVGSFVPEVISQIAYIKDGKDDFKGLSASIALNDTESIQEIKNELDVLNEKYTNITTNHWASLRGSVALREQCDAALGSAMLAGQQWLNAHKNEEENIDNDKMEETIITGLTSLSDKLPKVLSLLSEEVVDALKATEQPADSPDTPGTDNDDEGGGEDGQ